ncbi:Ig-like domain-containing protein [Catenovulum maritimum]|uniref:Cadherin domain-containing protein n=1 Tax=Catenovulum maritimum TaxID=1513271 RepID=A0A0J8GY59_9ALTE|nr:Ig-like domain-containing protein [Catenovulum maritimum]KMT65663.1 hypothetical protein XM47_08190 [Catenovulum maritimum]
MKLPSNFKKLLISGAITSVLIGCGGGGGGTATPGGGDGGGGGETPSTLTISGVASKGIIKKGVVKIFRVEANGSTGAQLATTVNPIITADDGTYSAILDEDYEGAIKITITPNPDGSTKMVCDVVADDGCGNNVKFGGEVSLTNDFSLSAVSKAKKTEGSNATAITTNVTPLTNIATKLFEKTASEGSVDLENAVTAANKTVAKTFQLGEGVDVSEIPVIDITDETKLGNADVAAFQAAAISAAIASKAVESGNLETFLTSSAENIAQQNGQIKAAADTNDNTIITLEDTLSGINKINSNLQTKIVEKIQQAGQDSGKTVEDIQAEVDAASNAIQNNSNISGAIAGIKNDVEQEIEDAQDNPDGLAGEELTPDDIVVEPVGPSLVGKLNADNVALDEDSSKVFPVSANDSLSVTNFENPSISITGVTTPTNGSAAIVSGGIQYTPNPDYNGSDSFNYTVTVEAGSLVETRTAKVTVTVNAVDDTLDRTIDLVEDSNTENTSGTNTDIQSVAITTAPTNGTATITSDNKISYTPNADYHGTDSLVYTVTLNSGATETGQYDYVISAVDDAIDDSVSIDKFTNESIKLLDNDKFTATDLSVKLVADDGSLVDQLTTDTGNTVTLNSSGEISYAASEVGDDVFSYQVSSSTGITETAQITVAINANSAVDKTSLVVDDMRTWGAYLFPDDFTSAGTLVTNTEAMLEVVDQAGPVFKSELSDLTIVGDTMDAIDNIVDAFDNDLTDLTVFTGTDLETFGMVTGLSGSIEIVELVDTEAKLVVDVTQGDDKLTLDVNFTIPADEEDDSTLVTKEIKATIMGMLDAGDTQIEIKDGSQVVVTTAGLGNDGEDQNEVLEIDANLHVMLQQDAKDDLTEDVTFEGMLEVNLVKGQTIDVKIYDEEHPVTPDMDQIDLYLPTSVVFNGIFTTATVNEFDAKLAVTISNAKQHTIPTIIVDDFDGVQEIEFDIETAENFLNAAAILTLDVNPSVASQGKATLTVTRDGYEDVIAELKLEKGDRGLVIDLDSKTEDGAISDLSGLFELKYEEDGFAGSSDDIKIVAEIRASRDEDGFTKGQLLATFEETNDGIVTVHYTGSSFFETFF